MHILFLGGTSFVGRHVAEAAIEAGHALTFFNRGVTDPELFAEQRHLRGDRAGDVSALAAVDADAVIDTSGYTPDAVLASARAVAGRVRSYVFMSSVDAYDLSAPCIDESSATKTLPEGASTAQFTPEFYGAHKALCERTLVDILGAERVIAVRAGLMAGPYDKTDRFTYWPVRVARGGEMLVPVGPDMPVQIIDVRDVARWIVDGLERGLHGTFNAVGTPGALTFGDVLGTSETVSGSVPVLRWASPEFLAAHGVGEWVEMPLWLADAPELRGLRNVQNERAVRAGLRLRPLADTIADILAEYRARPPERTLRAGLAPDREAALLRAWHDEIQPDRSG